MKKLSIGLILMISLFGCSNSKAKHQEKFLKHIHEALQSRIKNVWLHILKII